ncbi:MAG: hypothetical protein ACOC4J_06190 [Bacteroidota bacterium]
MSNIKIHKTLKDNFVRIPNNVLTDGSLSWKTKGILCYLLSKPENWTTSFRDIKKNGKREEFSTLEITYHENTTMIRTAFKELVDAGYAKLIKVYDEKNKKYKGSEYWISNEKGFYSNK